MTLKMTCIKCGGQQAVKNGFVGGWQRYKCVQCGYQYTKQSPQGQSIFMQILSSTLYLFGLSKREIARWVGVSPMSVVRWIKKYHIYYMTTIAPKEKRQVMTVKQVADFLKDYPTTQTMVITRILPSKARITVVIQHPDINH